LAESHSFDIGKSCVVRLEIDPLNRVEFCETKCHCCDKPIIVILGAGHVVLDLNQFETLLGQLNELRMLAALKQKVR
jgi:hypothetical protein